MMRESQKSKIPPCACCGNLSELDCWQYKLCVSCWRDWHKNVGVPPCNYVVPKVEVVDGKRVVTEPFTQDERAKQWSDATEAWLRKARAA